MQILNVNRFFLFASRLTTHRSFWWIFFQNDKLSFWLSKGQHINLTHRRWYPMRIASWWERRQIRRLREIQWIVPILERSWHFSRWKRRRNCWGFENGKREWVNDGDSSNGHLSSGTCNCPAKDSSNCTRSLWWWVSDWLISANINNLNEMKWCHSIQVNFKSFVRTSMSSGDDKIATGRNPPQARSIGGNMNTVAQEHTEEKPVHTHTHTHHQDRHWNRENFLKKVKNPVREGR